MEALQIISDKQNKILARREVSCTFVGGNGFITRQSAAEAIGAKLSLQKENVQIISLVGRFGNRDLQGSAYIFDNPGDVKNQLPKFMLTRQLSKDERKKAREEQKKAKASVQSSAGAKK